MKSLRGKRSKLSTRKKIRFTGVGSEPPCVPALRGDVQFATRGGEGSVEPSFTGRAGCGFSLRTVPRGASASVARAGQRRSGRGETAFGRVARGFGPASVQPGETARLRLSDRGGALESARPPSGGREVSTSPSTRSGRLTQRLRPTRLETRTKESNVHASRVAKETKTRKASLLYPSRG